MSQHADPLFSEPRPVNTHSGRAQRDEQCEFCGYPFVIIDAVIIDADSERVYCSPKCCESRTARDDAR